MRAIALLRYADDLVALRVGVSLGETVALTLAPPGDEAKKLLTEARAAGAVRTLRLWDDALATTDYLGVAYALAATVRAALGDLSAPPTAILCGDRGRSAVGAAVAERLSLPHLSAVVGCAKMGDRVVARRRSGGRVRLYAAAPPLVLCVADASVVDATATAAAGWEAAASESPEEVWTLAQAGLQPHELAYRKRFRAQPLPGPTAAPRVFSDARKLADRLKRDGLLGGGH
jgi:electron transfer flavoprotein alpha/beta subunit